MFDNPLPRVNVLLNICIPAAKTAGLATVPLVSDACQCKLCSAAHEKQTAFRCVWHVVPDAPCSCLPSHLWLSAARVRVQPQGGGQAPVRPH